jgi:predicted CopG family antitoxin
MWLFETKGVRMRTINETFTDEEFEELKTKKGDKSWHDFIIEQCKEGEGGA